MDKISRRAFLKAAGAAAAGLTTEAGTLAVAATPTAKPGGAPSAGRSTSQRAGPYLFFNAREAAFIEAAVARLIPNDETGPGALEAGVPSFIDKQLAGAWGAGERLYRSGPWQAGKPTQGYQLPFTPAELFRNALRAIDDDLRKSGRALAKMTLQDQDAYLKSLQDGTGTADLNGVPSNVFFESLLEMTIEGYFSDPVYGGNKDMAAWKMLGFPGAYANFYDLVDRHGISYTRVPMSLAEDNAGHVTVHPDIPADVRGKGK